MLHLAMLLKQLDHHSEILYGIRFHPIRCLSKSNYSKNSIPVIYSIFMSSTKLTLPCLALPNLALPNLNLPCLALPYLGLPCIALQTFVIPYILIKYPQFQSK